MGHNQALTVPEILPENFSKQELSAGQMKKRQILLGFLFPTHQQAARAVEPRVSTLHDPSPRAMSRKVEFLGVFLPAVTFSMKQCDRKSDDDHEKDVTSSQAFGVPDQARLLYCTDEEKSANVLHARKGQSQRVEGPCK